MKAGWETASLGDVCEMYQPKTITGKEMIEDGLYPVFGANGIIGRYDKYNHAEPQLLITCRGATCGSVNISEPKSWITGNAMVVRPRDTKLDLRFLEYYFRGGVDIAVAITGAAQPQITRTNLEPLEIRFPHSVQEQRRIVAILDEAFDGIETAKANADKNLKNARALFVNRVKSTFAVPADGWVKCELGSVCEMYQPKTITGKDLVTDGPYPVFGANGVIGRYTAYNHENSEVLVTCRGATCGAVNISEPRSWVTGNAMVVRPLDGRLDNLFLVHLLRNGVDLSLAITGAAQPQITRTNLSPLMISFPERVEEQQRLTAEFDELQSTSESLRDIYAKKISALDELKKSLLHQAFSGQL